MTKTYIESTATPQHMASPIHTLAWFFSIFLLLSFLAASQYYPPLAIPGIAIATCMSIAPLVGPKEMRQERLILSAISVSVVITAFYAPFIGLFMSLEGHSNAILVKILLGIRSAFYSVWLTLALAIYTFLDKRAFSGVKLLLLFFTVSFGLLAPAVAAEFKITYLLNSFLPLFATMALIPYIERNWISFRNLDKTISTVILIIGAVSLVYFPLLMLNLDLFRPDLALSHQSVAGRGLVSDVPPQWQSLLMGEFVPRFVGTFPNPILFGYFCAVSSYIFYFKKGFTISAVFALLAILTLSKGAILLLLTAHLFRVAYRRSIPVFLVAFAFLIAVELAMAYFLDGSNRVHLRGLIGGFKSLLSSDFTHWILGFGIGSGGNLARSQLEGGPVSEGWLASGSESGIGVLAYQLGLLGLSVFVLLCGAIFRLSAPKELTSHPRTSAICGLCAAWFSNMLLQEDLINVTISSQMLMAVVAIAAASEKLPRRNISGAPIQSYEIHRKGRA